jgi:hypothetical protein
VGAYVLDAAVGEVGAQGQRTIARDVHQTTTSSATYKLRLLLNRLHLSYGDFKQILGACVPCDCLCRAEQQGLGVAASDWCHREGSTVHVGPEGGARSVVTQAMAEKSPQDAKQAGVARACSSRCARA